MSTANNNFASESDTITAVKTGSVAVNQGDIVKLASNLVAPVAAKGDQVFGICGDTSPVASLGDLLTKVKVYRRGIFYLYLLAGDTVNFGDAVYLADSATKPQVVTTTNATSTLVGYVRETGGAVTGAASDATRILVELVPTL